MILKTHPEGSDLSNLGTSSLIRGVLVTEGIGVGMSDEDEGEGNGWKLFSRLVTLLISTSSFSVTWS